VDPANASTLAAALDAFGRGDLAALQQTFAPAFIWHVSSPRRFAGDRHGWPEFLGYLGLLSDATGGTMRLEPFEVFAGDTYGVALVQVTRSRAGKSVSNLGANIVRFEDGRIAEAWFLDENQVELETFYG
jgi:ketosteroid isomerase-like protein